MGNADVYCLSTEMTVECIKIKLQMCVNDLKCTNTYS